MKAPRITLPSTLQPIVTKTARATRTPESLATLSILGAVSAALGPGLQLRTAAHRVTRSNLYLVGFGPSGIGMSEVFRILTAPLQKWQRDRRQQWENEDLFVNRLEQAALEYSYHAAARHLGKFGGGGEWVEKTSKVMGRTISWARSEYQCGGGKEERRESLLRIMRDRARLEKEEHAPILYTGTPSSTRLATLLHRNNESLASISPDARAIFAQLLAPRSPRQNTGPDPGEIYGCAHGGEPSDEYQPKKSEEPFTLQSPCLSILWLASETWIENWFTSRVLEESGLISCFLACRFREGPELEKKPAATLTPKVLDQYYDWIIGLIEAFHDRGQPAIIDPTAEAARFFQQQEEKIRKARPDTLENLQPFVRRRIEQARRLALVLHAATHGADAGNHSLDLETARAACHLAEFFINETATILEEISARKHADLEARVLDLLDELGEEITPRDLQRKRITQTAQEAHQLLESIESLESEQTSPGRGGKVKTIYRLSESAET